MYTTQAPAKINLDLRIVATRADGYHEIVTVFQSVALADVLTLEPWDGPFRLTCSTPGVPIDATNLAWQGAAAVAKSARRGLDSWQLHLDKRVPAESGLGGGSADAAAAARLVLAAWGETGDDQRLRDVLGPIGADVAYFVSGGTAIGQGRGERLTALVDVPRMSVVIARPDVGVSTREAYGWFDAAPRGASQPMLEIPRNVADWSAAWTHCVNDLQAAVETRHPAIAEAVSRLRAAGADLALMSGSGSAVFGLFMDAGAARRAATDWPAGWRTWVTHTLSAEAYGRATEVAGPA
jgi:4-diphosphocytidyl-2-C-methyl-D-erythritol kinase